jgi:hypothetical protein
MRVSAPSIIFAMCLASTNLLAQDVSGNVDEITRLKRELQETRAGLDDSRRQIEELRQSLKELRDQVQGNHAAPGETASPTQSTAAPEPTAAAADQDVTFLAAKVSELHQDKVESASKYPVKLSGLILFNAYRNNGSLDIQDLPSLAFPSYPGFPDGSAAATLRQTMLGISATGPKIFGARTSANAEIDFAGGSPTTSYGVTAGLLRLRTANINLDWQKTSLHIGQDAPFFSPLSPTSYATVWEPALAWSGNLWVWTPQIEVEHRLTLRSDSALVLQGGLLDPLTEQTPPFQGLNPTAGEATRIPALAGRIAFDRSSSGHLPFVIGFGGYRARQRYQAFNQIDSWTVNTDLKLPFGSHFEVSGEWYDGQAVGGLGGGIWTSVVYPEAFPPQTAVHPLRSTGGWVQLKVKPVKRFEINSAFGQDENFARDLRFFATSFTDLGYPALKKNRTQFINFIYEPNSFLLFAVEYRHLFTAPAVGESATGDHLNLAAGVRF